MITEALVLMGVTALALLAALTFGGVEAVRKIRFRLEYNRDWKLALIEHELWTNLNDLLYTTPPVTNHRHNVHCPTCGRFSKRVMGFSHVVECKVHGTQVRWADMPVDWATVPVTEGVTLSLEPMPVTAEISIIDTTDTGPIWIADIEEMLELESLQGAPNR